MKFSKKILSILLVLLLFMAGVAGLYWDSYFFVVKKTKIEFTSIAANQSLKDEAQEKSEFVLKKLEGTNIWRLNLEEVREALLTNNWLQSVTVLRDLPDGLKIEAKFKPVVFLFLDARQRVIAISDEGESLGVIPMNQAPDLPFIKNTALIKDKTILRKMISLYQQLPNEGLISSHTISEVDWTDAEGFKVGLTRSDDGFIILGMEQVASKAKRVESVLKYLESQNQQWRVIDASFSKKVLVRLRKRS